MPGVIKKKKIMSGMLTRQDYKKDPKFGNLAELLEKDILGSASTSKFTTKPKPKAIRTRAPIEGPDVIERAKIRKQRRAKVRAAGGKPGTRRPASRKKK